MRRPKVPLRPIPAGGREPAGLPFQTEASGNPEIHLASMSVAPVPLPAGILLLPGALVFTGLVARERRRKPAAP